MLAGSEENILTSLPTESTSIVLDTEIIGNTTSPDVVQVVEGVATVASSTDNLAQDMLEIQQSLESAIISMSVRDNTSMDNFSSMDGIDVNTVNETVDTESEQSILAAPTSMVSDTQATNETITDNTVVLSEAVNNDDDESSGTEEIETEETDAHTQAEPVNDQEPSTSFVPSAIGNGPMAIPAITDRTKTLSDEESSEDETDSEMTEETASESASESKSISLPDAPGNAVKIIVEKTSQNVNAQTDAQRNIRSTASPGRETLVQSFTYKRTVIPVMNECSRNPSSINVMELQEEKPVLQAGSTKTITTPEPPKSVKVKNKIPVRKNSLPGTSANIQNIHDEIVQKQEKVSEKNPGKKPSKIVQPKVYLKALTTKTTEIVKSLRSYKKPAEPSKSKENKTIPKKKYFETCFSDDYQTSDDDSRGKELTSMAKIQVIYKNEDIDDPEVN